MISRIEMILLDVMLSLDLSNTFSFPVTRHKSFACSNFKDFKIEIWKF